MYSELQSIGQHRGIDFIFTVVRKLKILFKSNTQTSVPNFEASKNHRTLFENRNEVNVRAIKAIIKIIKTKIGFLGFWSNFLS